MNRFTKKLNIFSAVAYMVIYTTPIFRYLLGSMFRLIGMGMLGLWILTAICIRKPRFCSKFIALVLANICIFGFFFIAKMGNVSEMIAGYVAFWSFAIIFEFYFKNKDIEAMHFIAIALLIVITITAVTTTCASMIYPNISKNTYLDGSGSNLMYQLNVGGFDYVAGMCILVPTLIQLFVRKRNKLLVIPILTCVSAIFLSGYTIAFLIFMVGIVGIIISEKNGKMNFKRLALLMIILLIGFLFVRSAKNLVDFIAKSNEHLASRLYELIDLSRGSLAGTSDIASRFYFYQMSLKTFASRILYGVGPYYFYGGIGIGNHSQIFDDLARYGIGICIVYLIFIINFCKWIIKIVQHSKQEFYLDVSFLLFCLLSILNPTLILPILGLVLFVILPCLYYLD